MQRPLEQSHAFVCGDQLAKTSHEGPVLRLERDKFPTNARKPDKITRNKATKFEKVSARIVEHVRKAAPATPLEES